MNSKEDLRGGQKGAEKEGCSCGMKGREDGRERSGLGI